MPLGYKPGGCTNPEAGWANHCGDQRRRRWELVDLRTRSSGEGFTWGRGHLQTQSESNKLVNLG